MEITEDYKIQYAHITDVGCVRELNEDTLYCDDRLWLVADGMGGHACGEVASQLAAETISNEFSKSGQLPKAIEAAHQKIVEAAESGNGQFGMGTTVVALTSNNVNYQVSWVGDSRAYLWDKNKQQLTQLSEDHSLMVRLLKSGLISAEDAKNHPQRHMITQCLGSVEIENVLVDNYFGSWQAGQQILLCSDGLSDDVSEAAMVDILQLEISSQEKLAKLTDIAKNLGGRDNISIVLVDSPVQKVPSFWQKLKAVFVKSTN
ncbi:serine/threonine-protein phosphatase [Aliikangiella marina]|uniref:Serine/threonine-protein phosphatase n=1 Tax=Aliikangiella marina TaxID=1712262 RepID=A0A545T760_9GAMM|nr:protein phosphatase 2C domain-containing protein [Aliikangiella marina]TQV73059.1 serine/threonine-protein phosphatase [Aliikangiella marina]